MRVIITGGTGLIGSRLADSLAGDGHEAIVLTRSPQRRPAALPPGVRLAGWDGCTAQGWGELADGADAIVNLAGENLSSGRWTAERKRRIVDSRVNAGNAVVQAVEQAAQKPQVVIQASGVNYYGVHGDEILTEADPSGADFLAAVCRQWEAASAGVERMGVRRVVMRMGVVLSTRGGALPPMTLPFRLFAGGPIGSGRQWFSWMHVVDAVAAIRFFIANPQTFGAYNVCAPQPLPNRQFSAVLGKVMGRPAFFPAPAIAFQAIFGEMSTVLLDGVRVSPARLQEAGFRFRFPEAEPALRDLLKR